MGPVSATTDNPANRTGSEIWSLRACRLAPLLWLFATAAFVRCDGVKRPSGSGAIMSHVPTVAMVVLPFKPLWAIPHALGTSLSVI